MDTILSLERVAFALTSQFDGKVDMSDCAGMGEEERKSKFLSRALAAYCLTALTNVDVATAARSITDSFHDQGLDAIYFEPSEKTLFLVQSKWSLGGSKTIDVAGCNKFLAGINALMRADFSGFNGKIRQREPELKQLLMRSDVNILLVISYNSPQTINAEVGKPIQDFLDQQNNVEDREIFSLEVFNLARLYNVLAGSATKNRIRMQIGLQEWGTIDLPYRAYYGQMKIADIGGWSQHGKSLLARNIRFHQGSTDVNNALAETIGKIPDHFWYFNNGITIICSKIEKTPLNGNSRDYGVFDCDGVFVVNGGQTVSVICETAKRDLKYLQSLNAKVLVRLISLENCPEGFDTDVARATNTQNRIQNRDFAALDPTQQRLANDMALDGGKRYAFKSGDQDPKSDEGCNIEEATVALACATSDVKMAVQAKREVGAFWADIQKPPYTTIFNDRLEARHMWRAVKIMRAVADEIDALDKSNCLRGELVSVHGNRFLLYRVFRDNGLKQFRDLSKPDAEIISGARQAARRIFVDLAAQIESLFPNAYLANLFKNAKKCGELDAVLEEDVVSGQTAERWTLTSE